MFQNHDTECGWQVRAKEKVVNPEVGEEGRVRSYMGSWVGCPRNSEPNKGNFEQDACTNHDHPWHARSNRCTDYKPRPRVCTFQILLVEG